MRRRGSGCVPFRARSSTAAKRASLRCKLGSERRTSPKAQRNFSKLYIWAKIHLQIYINSIKTGIFLHFTVFHNVFYHFICKTAGNKSFYYLFISFVQAFAFLIFAEAQGCFRIFRIKFIKCCRCNIF